MYFQGMPNFWHWKRKTGQFLRPTGRWSNDDQVQQCDLKVIKRLIGTTGHSSLGDLKTRRSTGTSFQIEIHFSSQTSKFLNMYNLLRFQIFGELIIFFTEHDYKVWTIFIKENKRYKWSKTAKWIFNSVASSRPFAHGQIS